MSHDPFASIAIDTLSAVIGGGMTDWMKLPSVGKAPGVGPNIFMSALDKPGKTLDLARDTLGIAPSGRPGDTYTPASLGSDGSISQGRFDGPTSDVSPPISQ